MFELLTKEKQQQPYTVHFHCNNATIYLNIPTNCGTAADNNVDLFQLMEIFNGVLMQTTFCVVSGDGIKPEKCYT